MDSDEDVLLALDLAADERDVVLAGQLLAEGDRLEVAVRRREPHRGRALDELLRPPAVLDQVGDGDQPESVPLAEPDEVGHARHRPVLAHDLADDARRVQPREAREVDGSLGLARAAQHSTAPGTERKDVSGLDEVGRPLRRVDRDLDRVRAVLRGDPGRDALTGLDRDREGRLEGRLVVLGHLSQAELVAAPLGQTKADEAPRMGRHEVDRLGRGELGRDREVALVLAVGRVDDDHELALADVVDCVFDRRKRRRLLGRGLRHAPVIVPGWTSFSTYLARMSTSRLTASPALCATQRCLLERVRDERDLEGAVVDRADRQRDASDRD